MRPGDLAGPARSKHGLGSGGAGVNSRQRGDALGDVEIGLAKVFRVGEVVYLRAELYFHFLADRNVLEQRQVHAPLMGTVQLGARFVSNPANSLGRESSDVDPVVVILVWRRVGAARANVRTFVGHQVAYV